MNEADKVHAKYKPKKHREARYRRQTEIARKLEHEGYQDNLVKNREKGRV